MTREFVMLPEFDKQWKALGFSDDDLKALQEELAALRRQFQELLRASQVVSEPVSRAPSDVLKERPMSTEDFVKTIRGN